MQFIAFNHRRRGIGGILPKTLRIMQLTTALILGLCLQAAATGSAQTITFSGKDVPLEKVFKVIKEQTGFFVSYKSDQLRWAKHVTVKGENIPLEQFLNEVFRNQPLEYSIEASTIFIKWKKEIVAAIPVKMQPVTLTPPSFAISLSGRVTNDQQEPLQGVSVTVKGTQNGTTTNADGRFSLSVPSVNNVELVFSFVGFETQTVRVGAKTEFNIVLKSYVAGLEDVVVTALGVGKQKNSITYATQSIDEDEVTKVKDPSFMNALAGKVAGAIITKGNFGPGSSTRILLRGDKSFTGNSEPLYVVDGIPMYGKSDLLANINPEDIESMQVMKGASAAALYGSQAANGVLFITTKKGKNGTAVSFSSQATLENAVDLPKLQTNYGRTIPTQNDSWGDKITNGSDAHLKEFFKTGLTLVNSLSVSAGNELAQVYLSYANTDAKGILPENSLSRNNFTIRGTTQLLNKRLSLDGSVNYTNQKVYGQNNEGGYSSLPGIYSFPVDDDFSKYDEDHFEVWDPVRMIYAQNWPYIRNETFPNQNPYWVQKRNQREFYRNHAITSFTAKYKITDWLDIQGRGVYDKIDDKSESRDYATTQAIVAGANGGYGTSVSNTSYFYSDLLLIANKEIFNNFSLAATLGTSQARTKSNGLNLSSTVQTSLLYPNYFSVYALNGLFNKSESLRETLNRALFGNITFGYLNKLYLDITSRSEWSSTVSQSYSYPSLGLSYIAINNAYKENIGLSYLKLRASYAEVGNSIPFGIENWAPPYSLSNNGNINPRGSLPFFDGADTINLRPERTKSLEFGTDLRLLRDRITIGLTYYRASTIDQVFQIQAPAGAGATNFWINGGVIRNVGIEGTVSFKVMDGAFRWNTFLNFSQNKNTIRELSPLLKADYFALGGSYRTVSLFLYRPKDGEYGSYGDLFGKVYERDDQGNIVFGNNELPKITGSFDHYLGNANPKFLAGFNNAMEYKNISMSFLIDSRWGGRIFNRTEQWLDYKGLSERTGVARDNGGVAFEGKLLDAKAFYLNQTGAGAGGAAEGNMYDVTNIRLREVSLGYNFRQMGAFKLNLSLVGRNLFFLYKKAPFDPEIIANTSQTLEGISSFTMPSIRSFGISLTASF